MLADIIERAAAIKAGRGKKAPVEKEDPMNRREFVLQTASIAAAGARLRAQPPPAVKALTFDTFGTVVDYRSSIIDEGHALGRKKNLTVDWEKFADAWRAGYAPSMNRVRTGELPWTTLDRLHRIILDHVLVEFAVSGLTEVETADFNRVWHRLKPWPDAAQRPDAPEEEVHDRAAVERQRLAADRHGEACRPAVGLGPRRRISRITTNRIARSTSQPRACSSSSRRTS